MQQALRRLRSQALWRKAQALVLRASARRTLTRPNYLWSFLGKSRSQRMTPPLSPPPPPPSPFSVAKKLAVRTNQYLTHSHP